MGLTDFDTRAVAAGAISMALLGIGGTLALGQSILLVPVALVGGFVSGYLSRPGTTVTTNATAVPAVGYLLVAPVIVGRAVMADEFAATVSVADSALLLFSFGAVFVLISIPLVLLLGYLGGMFAERVTDSGSEAAGEHRMFD